MISLKNVTVRSKAIPLKEIQLEVPRGQYGILLGRPGSGKTVLMECLCGLRSLEQGQILLNHRDITGLNPAARGVGLIPNSLGLFPTMNVEQHLAFPLKLRRLPAEQIRQRVQELSTRLSLRELLAHKPKTLQADEPFRVALGRALASSPEVLCLDDPLSRLDEESRHEMRLLLQSLHQELPVTILHATQSLEEAHMLGDVVFQLNNGSVQGLAFEFLEHQFQARLSKHQRPCPQAKEAHSVVAPLPSPNDSARTP